MVHPNVLGVNVGKYYFAANYHQIVQKVHDLGGGLVLTLPRKRTCAIPKSGKYLRKYLHTTPDVDVEDRMRIYNLIRDLTADAYGGWHLVHHAAGRRRSARAARDDEPPPTTRAREGEGSARAGIAE